MSFAFNPRAGLIRVPTTIWGPKGDVVIWLALDTGASSSMIGWDWLVLVGYDPGKIKERDEIITGSGVEYAPRLKLKKIQALDVKKRNMSILCHTLPPGATVDGVLGLYFFRKKRLVLDFRKGLVSVD